MTKYFKTPFAENGDRDPIPDESVSGEVSFDSGYTPDYELPKTNLSRKVIERPKNNGLYHAITENLKFWQENGAPEIVADDGTGSPLSYGKGFVGSLGGVTYVAIIEGTTTIPPSAEWEEIDLSTLNQRVRFAGSISDLETLADTALDGDAGRLASGTGRDGDFRWDSSDLSATLVLASATSDSVDDTTDTINDADHPFADGDGVITQTTINGLTAQTVYWVVNSTSGTYQLSATFGGGAIDLTGTTNVTIDHLLDPLQGVYVTPTTDKTGSSGAWVRQYDVATINMYGAVGDGIQDDTQPIQHALNNHFHVIVPARQTPLITAAITVPSRTKLEFLGGHGNLATQPPSSYFIKGASMTGDAILIAERGHVWGGGVFGQAGNSGDGIKLGGNSAKLSYSQVYNCGNDGVRVGYDGVQVNCNSHLIEHVKSYGNGRHGIYVHDGYSEVVASADANAGTLLHCQADQNGGDGIKVGRAWWETVINPLTQGNTGWGMNVSSAIVSPDTVEECRYITILGGDWNEGNGAGSLNFAGFEGCVYVASANQLITKAGTGNNLYGGRSGAEIGQIRLTQPASGNPGLYIEDNEASVWDSAVFSNVANPSNGRGVAILLSNTQGRASARVSSEQQTTDTDRLDLHARNSGSVVKMLSLKPDIGAVTPGDADGTYSLGWTNARWKNIFSIRQNVEPSSAAPSGLMVGDIAVDDGTDWSGVNATGSARPVFWDGSAWVAMF